MFSSWYDWGCVILEVHMTDLQQPSTSHLRANYQDLSLELQRQFLTQCVGFNLSCQYLASLTGTPVEGWIDKLSNEARANVNGMSEFGIIAMIEAIEKARQNESS